MRRAIEMIHEIPLIPWWRIRERRRCTHDVQVCVHGDGINVMGGARAVCVACGRRYRDLPVMCAFTGEPHPSMVEAERGV
jgi:hypothetical protein